MKKNMPGRGLATLLALSLFLIVWGARTIVINRFGSDLPYWDQWPGEGTYTFLPWLERHDLWSPLLVPHSEHRIAPTRLLSLGLLLAGGQWDARVQCVVNAGIHAALVALFCFWLRRRVTAGWAYASAAFLALVFAPPIPWENVLGGFQSQFYFLIAFSLIGIMNCLGCRALSAGWILGVFLCFVSIVTMGSGMLCAIPVIGVAALRLFWRVGPKKDAALTLAAGFAVVLLGAYLYAPAAHHATIRAHTVAEFFAYGARCLAWPWPQWGWLGVVFWSPWCVLVAMWLKDIRSRQDPAEEFLVAAGMWILLQTAAVSYSRGGGSIMPSARYGDVTGLGVPLSFAIIALLASRVRPLAIRPVAVAYVAVSALAVCLATRAVWKNDLPNKRNESSAYERNVQAFVLTDDYSMLAGKLIPFPAVDWLRDFLRNPRIRPLLPASVRSPLAFAGFDEGDPHGLPYRRVHRVGKGARWESAILPVGSGWWKIETTGDLGQPGATLTLVAAKNHYVIGRVAPTRHAGAAWRAAYVRAPREPAVLLAETGAGSSYAFSEPIEVSGMSYAYWQICKHGAWIAWAGVLGLVICGVTQLRRIESPP